jgi:hypothetical protein
MPVAPATIVLMRDEARGEPEFDGHAALFLLLQTVGLAAGQQFHERGLAVVDVAGGAEGYVDLLRCHVSFHTPYSGPGECTRLARRQDAHHGCHGLLVKP